MDNVDHGQLGSCMDIEKCVPPFGRESPVASSCAIDWTCWTACLLVRAIVAGLEEEMLEDGYLSAIHVFAAGTAAEELVRTQAVAEDFCDSVTGDIKARKTRSTDGCLKICSQACHREKRFEC